MRTSNATVAFDMASCKYKLGKHSHAYTRDKKVFGILCLALLWDCLVIASGQCQFTPYHDSTTGDIMGLIAIEQTKPRFFPMLLQVVLHVDTTSLPTGKGEVKVANTTDELLKAVDEKLPIFYKIKFPKFSHPIPTPRIRKILLNGEYFCYATDYPALPYRPITLENLAEFRPPTQTTSTTTSTSLAPTPAPPSVETTTSQPNKEVQVDEADDRIFESLNHRSCGLVNPAIATDDSVPRHKFPWVAAVYFMEIEGKPELQCTGTLISKRNVLTAAGCLKVRDSGVGVAVDAVYVSLGRFDSTNWGERGSVTYDIEGYELHPDFDNSRDSADADLAIVKLTESVEFTVNIRPLCLWMGHGASDDLHGKPGFVIGWGNTGVSLRMTKVALASNVSCLIINENYFDVMSERTFCAKSLNGDLCYGYTGSGLVMFNSVSGRYHLIGMVSSAFRHARKKYCDSANYAVYVDVTKHLKWIYSILIQ